MPFSGNTFTLPAGSLATNGQLSDADTQHNAPLEDIETALTSLKTNAALIESSVPAINIKTFGAVAGGVVSCLSAVQAALTVQATIGGEIYVPPGKWLIDGDLACSGDVSFRGSGASSRLVFSSGSSLIYTGGSVSYPNRQLSLKDMSFRVRGWNPDGVIQASFSGRDFVSGTFRTVMLDNIDVQGEGANDGFLIGVDLVNCTNHVRRNVLIKNGQYITGQGADTGPNIGIRTGSIGIKISGSDQPINMYGYGDAISFVDTCVSAIGAGSGAGFEGLAFVAGYYVKNNKGIVVTSATVHDYVAIHLCNFDCYQKDVSCTNMHNLHVTKCLVYPTQASPAEATWVGIEIINDDPAFTVHSNNVISGNSFFGDTVSGSTAKTGISINASNSANTGTLVTDNVFSGTQTGVKLLSGSNNVKVTDTNKYAANVSTQVDNAGAASNVVAVATLATAGNARDNHDIKEVWGTETFTIDASLKVTKTLPAGTFKTALYQAFAQNSFVGGFNGSPITFDAANSTVTSLKFYVNGGTNGGSIQLTWRAWGN